MPEDFYSTFPLLDTFDGNLGDRTYHINFLIVLGVILLPLVVVIVCNLVFYVAVSRFFPIVFTLWSSFDMLLACDSNSSCTLAISMAFARVNSGQTLINFSLINWFCMPLTIMSLTILSCSGMHSP